MSFSVYRIVAAQDLNSDKMDIRTARDSNRRSTGELRYMSWLTSSSCLCGDVQVLLDLWKRNSPSVVGT
jgi:hypothetical protein